MGDYLLREERIALQWLADVPGGITLPGPVLNPATDEERRAVYLRHLSLIGLAECTPVSTKTPGKCTRNDTSFYKQTLICYTLTQRGLEEIRHLRGQQRGQG